MQKIMFYFLSCKQDEKGHFNKILFVIFESFVLRTIFPELKEYQFH